MILGIMQHEPQRLETGFTCFILRFTLLGFNVFIEVYQKFPDGHWERIELFKAITTFA